MNKIININKLSELISYMTKELDNFKKTKETLILDVQKISNCYKGIDASIIQNKYNETLNKTNAIILTLENYIEYLKNITSNYNENLEKTTNDLKSILYTSEKINNDINNNIPSLNINLNQDVLTD